MAPKKVEKKRRNKRKSRTEVSSSSSDSDSAASEPQQQQQPVPESKQKDNEAALNSDSDSPVFQQKKPKQDPEKAFEEFYLRQATREFANDLDKLRSAGDFSEKSLPILIQALKQGTACFSTEERKKIGASLST